MRVFPVAFFVSMASLAVADDGWWVGVGGAQGFGRHQSIRMVKEDVRVNLRNASIRVHATFWFRNEGPAATVQMGFPESRMNQEDGAIRGLASWVDGRRVRVRRKSLSADRENRAYEAVWLKSVRFGRGQQRRVVVSYTTDYSGSTSGDISFTYILRSGASWKGPIGDCSVTVDWSKMKGSSRPYLEFAGSTSGVKRPAKVSFPRTTQQVIRMKNFEPDYDLVWSMIEGFWHFRVNGKPASLPGSPACWTTGSRRDLRVPIPMLGHLIPESLVWPGIGSKSYSHLQDPPLKPKRMQTCIVERSGRPLALARPAKWQRQQFQNWVPSVYLKDLVRGLGGTYKYVPRFDRIDLWFPSHR